MISLKTIEADLLRIKLELDRALDDQNNNNLIQRNGSVRGRKFHVYNTLRKMQLRNQWKVSRNAEGSFCFKNYIVEGLHRGRRFQGSGLYNELRNCSKNMGTVPRYSCITSGT